MLFRSEFLAAAKRLMLNVAYTPGEDLARIVADAYSAPKETIGRVAAALKSTR